MSVAFIAIALFGANLIFVLRPLGGAAPPGSQAAGGGGLRGWARRHHATLLCLGRGTLNGSVATFGLIHVGHPVAASIAEGITAGALSGSFQLTVLNERFSGYLTRASGELTRILRWAWFQALFYGLVKAAGTLAGGGGSLGGLALAYLATVSFGSAQYPWEAAIAARRLLKREQGASRERIRFVADLQTMAVSVTCVGVSILNSVGVAHSRMFLVAVGVAGLLYYRAIRARRASRTSGSPGSWVEVAPAGIRRAAALVVLLSLAAPGAGQAAHRRRRRAAAVESPRPAPPALPVLAEAALPDPELETTPAVVEVAAPPPLPRLEYPDLPASTPGNPLVFNDGDTPRGYIPIPGTRSGLRIAGYLKLDAIHDSGAYTGDASDLPDMVLRGDPGSDQRQGLTRLHARESRLSLGTYTDTAAGPVVAFLEVDFFGAGGANTYSLRMRHAYLSWKWLLAGHTYSNFLDTDARGTTIEFNGPTAAGNRKRAQIRISHLLAEHLMAALALENGAADYTDPMANRVTSADSLLAQGSGVVQQVPDLTAQVRYAGSRGHLALRGMARQLRVLGPDGAGPVDASFGYGLAASGRWRPHGRSNLFAQATGGRGLGGYVDDLDGQAATFDRTGRLFVPQLGYAGLLGGELYLSERWRTNLIGSVSGVELADIAPVAVRPLSTRFVQLFANALYAPTPDLLIGLEYGYYRRETNSPLYGFSHRIQLGILYRFGG